MKLHFAGKPSHKAGSWIMRAEQISRYGEWSCGEDIPKNIDAVVIVKRIPRNIKEIQKSGVPIIYDGLDFWHQPDPDYDFYCKIQKFKPHFDRIKPNLVIATNSIMAYDIRYNLNYDTIIIPHHYDPHIARYKTKRKDPIIAYWGREQYLGKYKKICQQACAKYGFEFWINPPMHELSKVDAMVAFRDAPWDDYYSLAYKSNVKQATAQALRIPFYCFRERSYVECQSEETFFLEDEDLDTFPIKNFGGVEGHINDFSVDKCVRIYKDKIGSWLEHNV